METVVGPTVDAYAVALGAALGDLEGLVVSRDLRQIVAPGRPWRKIVDGVPLGAAMRRLGWRAHVVARVGPMPDRPRRCFQRGASRRVIYVLRCPITGALHVGHDPPRW